MTAVTTRAHPSLRALTWLLVVATLLVSPRAAHAQEAGEAVVVSPDNGDPVTGGGGATEFTIRLPDGAACPGDSEHEEYRVQSFIVPASVDPATLRYQGLRPQTEGGWPLYELNTTTYMNRPTDKAVEPGGEGTIINIPAFSFAVFEPGMLPIGRARIGIACTRYAATERYWATEIDVVADEADPAGISWTVIDPPAAADDGSAVPAAVGVAAIAAIAVVLVGRRRRVSADDRQGAARA